MNGRERGHRRTEGGEALLAPSLAGVPSRPAAGGRPWRLGSQVWVAFFGGVLAVTTIAYLNGRRLGLSPARLRTIVLLGVVGLAAVFAVNGVLLGAAADWREGLRGGRLGGRIVAGLVYLLCYRVQQAADRSHQLYGDGEYASLWKPGLAATFGLGLLQNLAVAGSLYALSRL